MKTILVDHIRGDSFGSEQVKEEISAVWVSQELAQQALNDIHENHEYYQKYNQRGLTPEQRKAINKEVEAKRWYYSARDYYRDDIEARIEHDFMPNDEKIVRWLEDLRDGVIEDPNNNQWIDALYVELDDGSKLKIDAFWHDYFARLIHAEIIEIEALK